MQATFFAPELSATSRTVVIWIMGLDLHLPLVFRNLGFGLDQDLCHAPALLLRDRARLDDPHLVTLLGRLVLVVALVLLLLGQVLAVLPVLGAALDLHHHRLRHLGGENGADAALGAAALCLLGLLGALAHVRSLCSAGCRGWGCFWAAFRCALLLPVFCVSSVRIRARSRLFLVTSEVASSVPARRRILRLKRFSRSSPALRVSSSTLSSFSSAAFISRSQPAAAADHPGVQGQLVRRERHGFLGDLRRHSLHLIEHAAHLHHGDPLLDIALAVAHARLGRLLGHRLVRKHADPDLPAALDEAGHGDAARLDLARGQAARLQDLEAVVAEGEIAPAVGLALVAALLLLAELGACWLHHHGWSLGIGGLLHRGGRGAAGGHAAGGAALLRALLRLGGRLGKDLAAEDPHLAADLAVGGLRLGEAVVDVGPERVQGDAPFAVPLVARHLRAAQAARAGHADALGAELLRRLDGLLHRAPEGDAALQLGGDVLGYQLRVGLRLADLDDVEEDLVLRELLQLLLDALDAGAALADHDARPRRVDVDLHLAGGALDLDLADARLPQLLLHVLAQADVLVEPLGVVLLLVPLGIPGADDAEPEPDRIDFLTHASAPLLLRRLIGDRQGHVAALLQEIDRAAHGPGHVAAQRGALVDHHLGDEEAIDVQRLVLRRLLGVGHRAPQQLGQRLRRPLLDIGELGERRVDVLAADEVRHHAHLAGRDAEVSEGCLGFHVSSPLLRGRRGRGGGGRRSRSSRGPGHGGAGLGFLVAGVAVERAGGSELAQLVADHVLGHEHRDELAPVVYRERVPHQVGKDGRTARPRLHHLLLALPVHVLHLLDQVAVDERALLDRTCHQRTPLSRRLMMNLVVRLLTRVLYPLVGWPQGETGCGLPWPLLPSPPPWG